MLTIFKQDRDKSPARKPAALPNIVRTIKSNLERAKLYWREMNWVVRSDHVLVGLLNQLNTVYTDPLKVYASIEVDLGSNISSRGFVTPIFYGRVQPKPFFYGEGCQEILIDQRFDDAIETIITKHYTEWDPIRVVRHPFTTFDYQLANGKKRMTGEQGLVILKIDVAMLAAQYRAWRDDILRSQYEDGTNKSIMNFVHSYPVVNMLDSHTECVWFNRFLNRSLGRENRYDRGDQRLMLIDSYTYVDKVHDDLINLVKRSRADFAEWICWIPGLLGKHYKAFLKQDNVLSTHQNKLVYALGYYPALEWLFKTEYEVRTGSDTLHRNEYLKAFREYKSNRTFGTIRGLKIDQLENLFNENITYYADLI